MFKKNKIERRTAISNEDIIFSQALELKKNEKKILNTLLIALNRLKKGRIEK